MNKLFVNHPLFRLLSPLFSGTLVYLLILLINDSVQSVFDDFLGQELYVCIGLAYLTQEFSRLSLLVFERLKVPKSFILRVLLQVLISMILTITVVSIAMYFYFKYMLLYTVNIRELYVFNSIFSFITLLYVVIYLGHYFLFRRNTIKIKKEEQAKLAIESNFQEYKKGINPDLLFESLEAMLITMKEDPDQAERLTDHFSSVYRYILSKKGKELVQLHEELEILDELKALFNHLPFRKTAITTTVHKNPLLIPTSILSVVETIIRTTIASEKNALNITITEEREYIKIQYQPEEKLTKTLSIQVLSAVQRSYQFYSEAPVTVHFDGIHKIIQLPKLIYHEGSHT